MAEFNEKIESRPNGGGATYQERTGLVPGGTARDVAFAGLPNDPTELLHEVIYPEDAFDADGTYWADLPAKRRTAWINRQANSEASSEFGRVWDIFKGDPLKPFWLYFRDYVVTGLGFFAEGYVLFSVGNVITLLGVAYPACWADYTVCSETWTQAVNYLEIVGIICGQILIGIIGDWVGRRWGLIQDAVTMMIGSILLTAMWGTTLNGWVIMYALSLLIFGIGVGGEYPMTSLTAMEGVHGHRTTRYDKLHRGRSVLLAFLMQGWGQLANQVVLIVLLLIFNSGGYPPYSHHATQATFRVSFGFAVVFFVFLIYLRVFKLKNVDQSSKASKKRQRVTGYDTESLKLVLSHYWHRLLATALCWFCNDFPFYGNQIFRDTFLSIVTSNDSQVNIEWYYNLINIGCELCGYYLAALLVDHKAYGRRTMQAVGFLMTFLLFVIAASIFPQIDTPGAGGKGFIFIYFFSSFWIQFGSNSTTFLLAAELYPAPIRATAHGCSAAVGKLGALSATVLYNYIATRTKFWVVCWFGLVGFVLTVVFIPDTTGLDLREQERYWRFVREGRPGDYHGIAVHPRHLSVFERFVLKRAAAYDPKLDKEAKIEELRQLYELVDATKGKEGTDSESDVDPESASIITSKVSTYFEYEKSHKS